MTIQQEVTQNVEKTQGITIKLPDKTINLIQELKKIPRTGKSTRIDKYSLKLPKRSLYDHLISLSIQGDIFLKYTKQAIDKKVVAKCIAYHELPETIAGDVSDFTTKEIAGALYKTEEQKIKDETEAEKIIEEQLTGEIKEEFISTIRTIHEAKSQNYKFFKQTDKTDPIIGVWRYIHLFRKQIEIDKFLEAMTDFFTNPKVKDHCVDTEIEKLREYLQNKENAKKYFETGQLNYSGQITQEDLKLLIERKMHLVK